jgi:starch phosphorylase
LEKDNATRAKALAAWIARLHKEWSHVRVEAVELDPKRTLTVGSEARVRACVQLGSLLPEDVAVELYLGRLNPAGDFVEAVVTPMKPFDRGDRGNFSFEAMTACPRSGMHGFTIRIRPDHPDLSVPFLPGLICWADAAHIGT